MFQAKTTLVTICGVKCYSFLHPVDCVRWEAIFKVDGSLAGRYLLKYLVPEAESSCLTNYSYFMKGCSPFPSLNCILETVKIPLDLHSSVNIDDSHSKLSLRYYLSFTSTHWLSKRYLRKRLRFCTVESLHPQKNTPSVQASVVLSVAFIHSTNVSRTSPVHPGLF